jgi:AraC-like DNA-binding protein
MDEIADRCGFGSSDVLARAFTRLLRLTPANTEVASTHRASENRLGAIRRDHVWNCERRPPRAARPEIQRAMFGETVVTLRGVHRFVAARR